MPDLTRERIEQIENDPDDVTPNEVRALCRMAKEALAWRRTRNKMLASEGWSPEPDYGAENEGKP